MQGGEHLHTRQSVIPTLASLVATCQQLCRANKMLMLDARFTASV